MRAYLFFLYSPMSTCLSFFLFPYESLSFVLVLFSSLTLGYSLLLYPCLYGFLPVSFPISAYIYISLYIPTHPSPLSVPLFFSSTPSTSLLPSPFITRRHFSIMPSAQFIDYILLPARSCLTNPTSIACLLSLLPLAFLPSLSTPPPAYPHPFFASCTYPTFSYACPLWAAS